jgi:hypothetical protein
VRGAAPLTRRTGATRIDTFFDKFSRSVRRWVARKFSGAYDIAIESVFELALESSRVPNASVLRVGPLTLNCAFCFVSQRTNSFEIRTFRNVPVNSLE